MYIAPNSTLVFLKNVPLDTTYNHTLYFESAGAQSQYFLGLAKYTLQNQSYQRASKKSMRVEIRADDLYDCNYIAFKNTSFGDKWFYAFLQRAEYVNNITSEVTYQLDVMQTWAFDYTLRQCLVEREHTATDVVGENTVPESLETGEYVTDDFDGTGRLGPKSIVVASTFDDSYEDVGGAMHGGIYSALHYSVFDNDSSGADECTAFLRDTDTATKADGLVSVFLMPTAMTASEGQSARSYTVTKSKNSNLRRSDGTAVKNNKLKTWPFNFLYVTNLQGTFAEFKYEDFNTPNCQFTLAGDMTPNPSCVLVPRNYKGAATNYDEKITLSGFPQLCYATDSYKQWLSQSALGTGLNALSSIGTTVTAASGAATAAGSAAAAAGLSAGAVAAAPVVAAAAVVGLAAATTLAPVYQHSKMPDQARGAGSPQTLAALGVLDFAFMHKHIKPEYVTIIDDYFTMFGYACHRVKIPNRVARPHWTYTKTIGCVITGSIPCDDAKAICDIYDKGITFWRRGDEVGNYNLDNSV